MINVRAEDRKLGPVQRKVLRMCRLKPGTEVLLKSNDVSAARRLEQRGFVIVKPDYFGVWCILRTSGMENPLPRLSDIEADRRADARREERLNDRFPRSRR